MFFKSKKKELPIGWSGSFKSWEEAASQTGGYDQSEILERVKASLLKVKNGEAVYERDSVLFNKKEYSWAVLAILLKAATENENRLQVLDFGGSLGSGYYQNREFMSAIKKVCWNVVEQKKFVEEGKKTFETEELRFFGNIEDVPFSRHEVLLASSVVQYLKNPYAMMQVFKSRGSEYLVFDRTAFIESEDDMLTIQRVPPQIYEASYPAWFFAKKKFINFFSDQYQLISEFESGFTAPAIINSFEAKWSGLIFQIKKIKNASLFKSGLRK